MKIRTNDEWDTIVFEGGIRVVLCGVFYGVAFWTTGSHSLGIAVYAIAVIIFTKGL